MSNGGLGIRLAQGLDSQRGRQRCAGPVNIALTDPDIPVGPFPRLLIERFEIETYSATAMRERTR